MAPNPVTDPHSSVVGFVGPGQQGGPMAANLIEAGYRLVVRDTDLERERRLVAAHGGRGCDGDPAVLAELLEAMAERIFRAGPLGSGHAMKTLNNYVSAAGLAAALDAIIAGQRFGVDVETMLDVFNAGTARNFSTANTLIDESMSRRYEGGFQLALMVKDLRIASSLFERVGFDAPISELVRDQFAQALAQLHDQYADLSRSLEDWERRGDVRVPPPRQHNARGAA
ncbi:MAG: NAD-binding protein [Solirubrobacterales bacterium]|nr:NAD-binding protein [Solirubrobacterales bacterium]